MMDLLRMPEGDGGGGPGGDPPREDLIPRSEAQKAFAARDELKAEIRKLRESGLVLTPEQRAEYESWQQNRAKMEEDKLKRAGEWDKLRSQLDQDHQNAIKVVTEKAAALEHELQDRLRGLAFAQASEWFGPAGKTILPPDIAESYFARYIAFDEHRALQVKDLTGQVILDAATGRPMAFEKAIGILVQQLPNRDQILRGSGKTGSGSSGGAGGMVTDVDLDTLTKRAQFGDPDAIKKLRERQTGLAGLTGTRHASRGGS